MYHISFITHQSRKGRQKSYVMISVFSIISLHVWFAHGASSSDHHRLYEDIREAARPHLEDFPLKDFITPRDGVYPISEQCRQAGDRYLKALGRVLCCQVCIRAAND